MSPTRGFFFLFIFLCIPLNGGYYRFDPSIHTPYDNPFVHHCDQASFQIIQDAAVRAEWFNSLPFSAVLKTIVAFFNSTLADDGGDAQ